MEAISNPLDVAFNYKFSKEQLRHFNDMFLKLNRDPLALTSMALKIKFGKLNMHLSANSPFRAVPIN